MRIHRSLVAGAALTGLVLLAVACSSSATPEGTTEATAAAQQALHESPMVVARTGLPPGVMPIAPKGKPAGLEAPPPGSCTQLYYGGPVLQRPEVVSVFWTHRVDPNLLAPSADAGPCTTSLTKSCGIGKYYEDITNSTYMDMLSEYTTVGVTPQDNGAGTSQGISRGGYGGHFTIKPSKCAGTGACTLQDTDIQNELYAQIKAGNLPAPVTACDGQTRTIYMFEFPANVTIDGPSGAGASCSSFCAYHYHATLALGAGGASISVPYGVHPNMEQGACANACSLTPPASWADVMMIHAHEFAEAVTDAEVSFTTSSYVRPAAWGSAGCGEVGDACAWSTPPVAVSVGGDVIGVQTEWSNAQNGCAVSGSPKPVCTGANTPPGCRACVCSDDHYTGPAAQGCDGATPVCETRNTPEKGYCVAKL